MKIVIDFDSTIINTSKTLLNAYNKETGSNLDFNPYHKWDFEGLFPKSYHKRAFELFVDETFYDYVEEMPGAIDRISELSKNNEIIIATKHHPLRIPNTQKWIDSKFDNVKVEYLDSFDKSCLSGDIFIDDRIDCLESVKGNFEYIICFGDYNWNKEWDGWRYNSWNIIYHTINRLNRRDYNEKIDTTRNNRK